MVIRKRNSDKRYLELEQPYRMLAENLDAAIDALNEIDRTAEDEFPNLSKLVIQYVLDDLINMCEDCSEAVWDRDDSISLKDEFDDLIQYLESCDVSDFIKDMGALEELADEESDEGEAADYVRDSLHLAASKLSRVFDFVSNLV